MSVINYIGTVVEVSSSTDRQFSKDRSSAIKIAAGHGVVGDVHGGKTIKHRSRMEIDPNQPNLRQVHLMPVELLEELDRKGFEVNPGDLGENITTRGIDLINLSRDTILRIGAETVLSVTGLRNPCVQIEQFAPGLLNELAYKANGEVKLKAGIMCIALCSGTVRPTDEITVYHPEGPHIPLERV